MADQYETGAIYGFSTPTLPSWQRTYYESKLLETLRVKSIIVPFTQLKEDFNAVNTKQIVFSEVLDLEPNWNETLESTIWKKGMSLDSRTVTIDLKYYHDIIKYSDHLDVFTYLNGGDARGIVRDKLGQAMVDMLDILALNAHLTHPAPSYAGTATSRATLASTDLFDPDVAEDIRVSLEEDEVPGVASVGDGAGATILCATTPRVIHDIRTAAGSDWLDVQKYEQTGRKFTGEAGMWAGVRFVKTNRLRLRNRGLAVTQTTLSAATVEGQGAASTVDSVYTPGQTGSTRYVTVADETGFAVGQYVTIHAQGLGTTVLDGDGTQETRRIVSIDAANNRLSFDKPLLKAHASGDYVTNALDVHASIFWGGPGVVYGVAERPNIIVPPKYDDAMLINRIGWRGLLKFQLFRPEVFRVHLSAGSA
ncbi:MAG TPA: N4-gp56 family major capsid protein [Bellilinea sp.]|nr:N4-gp56 family major capsid protein [Bellilinea sp.]